MMGCAAHPRAVSGLRADAVVVEVVVVVGVVIGVIVIEEDVHFLKHSRTSLCSSNSWFHCFCKRAIRVSSGVLVVDVVGEVGEAEAEAEAVDAGENAAAGGFTAVVLKGGTKAAC